MLVFLSSKLWTFPLVSDQWSRVLQNNLWFSNNCTENTDCSKQIVQSNKEIHLLNHDSAECKFIWQIWQRLLTQERLLPIYMILVCGLCQHGQGTLKLELQPRKSQKHPFACWVMWIVININIKVKECDIFVPAAVVVDIFF